MFRACFVAVCLVASVGCSKESKSSESRCQAAFDHMSALSDAEFAAIARSKPEMAKKVEAEAKKNDPARRAKFVAKCEEGAIDVDCIMEAKDTMMYIDCLAASTAK